MESRQRQFLFAICAVLIAIIVALVACEIALRVAAPVTYVPDPVMDTIHRPGGEYDDRGFRNPTALSKADIVAIGDSQTEGNNATSTEAWPLVLAQISGKAVYSMAIGGYGPVQYAALTPQALALKPKVLIVGFYFGNDLLDAEHMAYDSDSWKDLRSPSYVRTVATSTNMRAVLGSGVVPGTFQYWALTVRTWIRNHSMVYALAGNATRGLRERLGLASTFEEKQAALHDIETAYPDLAYVYDSQPGLKTVLSPSYRLQTVSLDDSKTAEGWRITENRFLAIKKETDDAGVSLVMMLIPTKEKVYLEYMHAEGESIPRTFDTYLKKENELTAVVMAFCRTQGIICFSPLHDMVTAMQSGATLYGFSMDGHPIPAGYRVIAESIAVFLKSRFLLPQ